MHFSKSFPLLFALVSFAMGQGLGLTVTNTRLPTPLYWTKAVYDGDDKIYILGGKTYINMVEGYTDEILEYSISNETITLAGRLPTPMALGSAVWNGNGSAYYFGGWARNIGDNENIWQFTPGSYNVRVVGKLPGQSSQTDAVWDGVDNAYIIPGGGDNSLKVIRFTESTGETRFVSPDDNIYHFGSSAAWDANSGNVFYFGGYLETFMRNIYRFNPVLNDIDTVPVTLLWQAIDTGAVFDGHNIIIMGGRNRDPAEPVLFTGVALFDPLVMTVTTLNVANVINQYHGFGTVYVPKLKRVYLSSRGLLE